LRWHSGVVTQWRIELSTQDVVALSRGEQITVTAVDEEQDLSGDSIEVTVALLEY
jgi:hypothetical protein